MRRILYRAIVFMLMFAMLTVPVSAEGEGIYLSADKTSVEPGETVTVSIMLVEGTQLIGGDFQINYNEEMFEYTSEAAGNTGLMASSSKGAGYVKVSCIGMAPTSNTTVYSFTFTALSKSGIGEFDLSAPNGITVGSNYTDLDSGYTVEGINVAVKVFSTSTSVTVGSNIVFNIAITDCPDSGVIYAAIYDGTILKTCGKKEFTSAITNETITVDTVTGDTFKVFIWDVDGKPLLETPEEKELN